MKIKSHRSFLLFLIVLIITLIAGLGMVVAADNTTTTTTINHTSTTTQKNINTTNTVINTNNINNTQEIIKENKSIQQNNINTKTLKSNIDDVTINDWNTLVNQVQSGGTFKLTSNLTADTQLNTTPTTTTTINGNGHTITFKTTGRIYIASTSTLNMANITLDGNHTERENSGVYSEGTLIITNSTIKNFNNTIMVSDNSAIFNKGANNKYTNNTFINNTVISTQGGSAIFNIGDNFTCNNNIFTYNNATIGFGGAIYNAGMNSTFNNNTFNNNYAGQSGGAIYNHITGVNNKLTNNTFNNNTATFGGAIYNDGATNCTYYNNTFNNNIATVNASAIYNTANNQNISSNTFTGNLVACGNEGGETLYINGTNNVITNNIYLNNSIAFSNKTITRYVNDIGNIIITTDVTLANPQYYDSDILDKTTYYLVMTTPYSYTNYTKIGNNSVFRINQPTKPYKTYAMLNIAQSTYKNNRTNDITKYSKVICTVNNITANLGENTILSANFTTENGTLVPRGKVAVKINGNTLNYTDINNGTANYTLYLNPMKYGGRTYNITFVYGGITYYLKTQANGTLTINKYTPKFTYTPITTTKIVGDNVQFTVKITNENNTFDAQSGKVGIKVNGVTYCKNSWSGDPVLLKPVNGVVTFNITITSITGPFYRGNNNKITFTYSGNSQFNTGRITIENALLIKASTNITVTYGDKYTSGTKINVRVTSNDNTAPNGNVKIYCDGGVYQTQLLDNGKTTFNVVGLPAGTQNITVKYMGSTQYEASNTTSTQEIILTPTKITATYKNTTTSKTITVNVTSSDDTTPNGNVKIYYDGGVYQTQLLNEGQTTFNITGLPTGIQNITVKYMGSSKYKTSNTTVNIITNLTKNTKNTLKK